MRQMSFWMRLPDYKTMTKGILTVSVNWDDWQEVGMSV